GPGRRAYWYGNGPGAGEERGFEPAPSASEGGTPLCSRSGLVDEIALPRQASVGGHLQGHLGGDWHFPVPTGGELLNLDPAGASAEQVAGNVVDLLATGSDAVGPRAPRGRVGAPRRGADRHAGRGGRPGLVDGTGVAALEDLRRRDVNRLPRPEGVA